MMVNDVNDLTHYLNVTFSCYETTIGDFYFRALNENLIAVTFPIRHGGGDKDANVPIDLTID